MITDVPGVRLGHWTNREAETGCTVVTFPDGTIGSGEVRGGAPATREFALLDPSRMVQRLDAVVLTGGSAFGLATADGVCRDLADAGIGFETVGGPVPIVVAMALFDLAVGDGSVRPGAAEGTAALAAAAQGPHEVGLVGAATGATMAKWRGPDHRRPGGLVTASVTGPDGLVVAALVAVNAVGEPGADAAAVAAELRERDPAEVPDAWTGAEPEPPAGDTGQNTTIGVVATNALVDKRSCHLLAQAAHDGLSMALTPAHTQGDGDAFVVAATGEIEVDPAALRASVVEVVVRSIAGLAAD